MKYVQTGMDAVLKPHGLKADASNGCSISMRRHGITNGWLDLFFAHVSMYVFLYSKVGQLVSCMLASPKNLLMLQGG